MAFLNFDQFPNGEKDFENERKVILGFLKHNYHMFKHKVHLGILLRLVPGISFVIYQLITQYLLKTVSLALLQKENNNKIDQVHFDNINLLGSIYLCNFIFSYLCDYCFFKLRLGSCVKLSLRSMCVDTVIQLTQNEIDNNFDIGKIIKTNDKYVDIAVHTSWINFFNFLENIIKLLFMFIFLFYTSLSEAQALKKSRSSVK